MKNKGSSVDYIEEMIHRMIEHGSDFGDDLPALLVHIQKAKERHEEEIIDAYDCGFVDGYEIGLATNKVKYNNANDYHKKTFTNESDEYMITPEEAVAYMERWENNKYNQIIGEVYEKYSIIAGVSTQVEALTKEEFINKVKTDSEFAKKWGLKVEVRELSLGDRGGLFRETYPGKSVDDFAPGGMEVQSLTHQLDSRYNKANIPTKSITIEYNNEKIEIYE